MAERCTWPSYLEMNVGDIHCVRRTVDGHPRRWRLRLVEVQEIQGDTIGDQLGEQDELRTCEQLKIRINNIPVILYRRAFQPPVCVDGLRVYVETTQIWADRNGMEMLRPTRQVRLSAVAENETWGAGEFRLPVDHLHWNALRGLEHWGFQGLAGLDRAEMERLTELAPATPVRSAFTGELAEAETRNHGPWNEHRFILRHEEGFELEYFLREKAAPRRAIHPREKIQAQWELLEPVPDASREALPQAPMDLGMCLTFDGLHLAIFPFLLDAWVMAAPAPVWVMTERAILARAGQPVLLDGTRRMALNGCRMESIAWVLHDGRRIDEIIPHITIDRPGVYTEELLVRDSEGRRVRDFLEVRVLADERYPMTEFALKEVEIGPRQVRLELVGLGDLNGGMIDYGDGQVDPLPAEPVVTHQYDTAGQYVITLTARQHNGQPVLLKTEIDTREQALARSFG